MSPTRTATPAGPVFNGVVVDDFEDADTLTINGGNIGASMDANGSSIVVMMMPPGCNYGTVLGGCQGSGTVVQDTGNDPFARIRMELLAGGGACDLRPIARQHSLTFNYFNGTPGVSYRVCLESGSIVDGDQYCFDFTPTGTGWQRLTVYFPDVAGTGIPRLAQNGTGAVVPWGSCVNDIRACTFGPVPSTGGPLNFDLTVDDVHFGPPPGRNNPNIIRDGLGATDAIVRAAYELQVDEFLTWVIIRLAVRCGCTPQDIYARRDTRHWGEIAIEVGTTWEDILTETETMAVTGGFVCPESRLDQVERALINNPPLTPNVTPEPVVPGGVITVPPALSGCI